MAIFQKQIAKELNISAATVSRSLKNDSAISAHTKALVLETARRMGYNSTLPIRKNHEAVNSNNERMPICAVIQSDFSPDSARPKEELMSEYLAGMSEEACKLNTSLMVHYVPLKDRDRAFDSLPFPVRNGQVSGIVLIHYFPVESVRAIAKKYTCLSIAHDYDLPNVDVVGINQPGGIFKLMKHLYQQGHRKIGFAGEMARYSWALSRMGGYIEALIRLNLDYLSENVFEVSTDSLDSELAIKIKKQIDEGMTGLICSNDNLAYKLMHELKKLGIEAPRDFSITGFDAITHPEGLPQLQSIRHPGIYMGAVAARSIIERNMQPSAPCKQLLFEGTMVNGNSVSKIL